MKTKNHVLFTVLLLVLFSSAVFAVPGVPHRFFGTVSINGAPAPDGTIVSAKIDGVVVASKTTSDGKYGYSPNIFYINDPDSILVGSIVRFFVNGVDSGSTAYFENFASTWLNLSVTIAQAQQTADSPSNGGGGNGGGSNTQTVTLQTKNNTTPNQQAQNTTSGPCEERWICEDWSACVGNLQKRTCKDANKCGTIDTLPMITQPCSLDDVASANNALATQTGQNRISGLFLSAASSQGIIIIIFSALVIYFGFQYFKKNGSKK